MKTQKKFVRIITALSATIFVLTVITPPVAYYFISYHNMTRCIETKGLISSAALMTIISQNRDAWEFQKEGLRDVLSGYPRKVFSEQWRILNADNQVVAASAGDIKKPIITRSFDLMDAGVVVGRLEISGSTLSLLKHAIMLAFVLLPIGTGAFLLLCFLPMRRICSTEEALGKSKQLCEKTFSSLRDAIIISEYDTGKIIDCNGAATHIFGYRREEMLGQTTDLLYSSDEANRICDACLTSSSEKYLADFSECEMKRKDGSMFLAEHAVLPLEDNGKIICLVSVVRDITERKKNEEESLRSEKLESLGLLASGIAHDFNNLMTGVLGNLSLLKNLMNQQDSSYQILQEAERAALKTKALTLQFLTFSKSGSLAKKAASIVELVKESAHLVLSGSNARAEFVIPEEILAVEIDEVQIAQVMDNLIINARQAMPEGGVITISFANIMKARNNHVCPKCGQYLEEKEYVKIAIADHGCGIPREHLSKIFDPYFTTKQEGSGLGLATAYSIVKRHGGHISVESEVGLGTTFSVYLPAVREKHVLPRAGKNIPPHEQRKILVMDDKEVVREAAKWMLSSMGFTVIFARDGDEAIARYTEALQAGAPFDAVILDVTIPGGMGGGETIEKLYAIDPHVKAIISSGYASDIQISDYRKYGFVEQLEKPYRMQELRDTLSRVLDSQR